MELSPAFSLVMLLMYVFLVAPPASSSTTATAAAAAANSTKATSDLGFRSELTHVDAAGNFSRAELMKRAAHRSKMRAKFISALGPVSVHPSQGEYLMDLAIGTPPLSFTGILDTGSDLIWTQCKTCGQCIPQPSPLFDPLSSSTFSTLPCSNKLCHALPEFECAPNCFYHYHYGDNTDTRGFLGTETFTFGSTKKVRIPLLGFGCGLFNGGDIQNSSGIIGFGRGPLSLISQLGVGRFSYCLTSSDDISSKSPLLFGSLANLNGPRIKTTPLLPSPASATATNPASATFYYLSLKGITVGRKLLPIPPAAFELKKDGSGGTIIDSGTAYLQLNEVAFKQVLMAFKSQVKLPAVNSTDTLGFELCFKTPNRNEAVPKLIFHFQGADWDLPTTNYMGYNDEAHLLCLLAQTSDVTTFGNVATENMHVLYDLKNNKLSFVPAKCDQV